MSGEVCVPKEAIEAACNAYEAALLDDETPRDPDDLSTHEEIAAVRAAAPLILAANRDIHLVAYASLYETVRRFLEGEANVKYLRKRHGDIEEDLQRAVVLRGEQTSG